MTIDEKKLALSSLFYESWMFNELSKRLVGLSGDVIFNAFLESFLIHTRIIVDFLEDKKYDSDIRCSDFGIEKQSVNLPLGNTLKEINLWLAHITKERIKRNKPKWKYPEIRNEVNKCLNNFLQQIPPEHFPSENGKSEEFKVLFD